MYILESTGDPQKSGGQKNMIRSRQKKYNSMGFEKDLEGRKFLAQQGNYKHELDVWENLFSLIRQTIRVGAINANAGGWHNGKRTAASMIEKEDPPVKFPVPVCPMVTYQGPMIQLNEVTFSYEPITDKKPALLQNISLTIPLTSKLTLLGPNGIGKSTLIRLILGELHPVSVLH